MSANKPKIFFLKYQDLESIIRASTADKPVVNLGWQTYVLVQLPHRPQVAIAWPTHDAKTVLLHHGKTDYQFGTDRRLADMILSKLDQTAITQILFPYYE